MQSPFYFTNFKILERVSSKVTFSIYMPFPKHSTGKTNCCPPACKSKLSDHRHEPVKAYKATVALCGTASATDNNASTDTSPSAEIEITAAKNAHELSSKIVSRTEVFWVQGAYYAGDYSATITVTVDPGVQ